MPDIITDYGTWDAPAVWDANNGYGFRVIDSVGGTPVVRLLAPAYALTLEAKDARDAAQGALAGALAAMPTRWSFDTATGAADPGSGKLRLNNVTQNAATAIYVDSLNADGTSVAALLAALGGSDSAVKATITLIDTADPTKWLEFAVSAVTDSTGYYTLAVMNVGGSSASPFADGAAVALARSRTGDKGDQGDQGIQGVKGDPGDIADLSVYPAKTTPVGADLVPIGDSEDDGATKVTTVGGLRAGLVAGPASVTANTIALFDGETGKLIKAGPTIGAAANQVVQLDGDGKLPAADGSQLTNINTGLVPLGSPVVASNSATVDVEFAADGAYDNYIIMAAGVTVSSDGVQLRCQMKVGGSYGTSSAYQYHLNMSSSGTANYSGEIGAPQSYINIFSQIGNETHESASFELHFSKPDSTTLYKIIRWSGVALNNSGGPAFGLGVGSYGSAAALTGFRFYLSGGNILTGTFQLYGIRKGA